MFSIDKRQWNESDLPDNSGIVTLANFKEYYGPFARRAFFITSQVLNLDPNEAAYSDLVQVPKIGEKKANKILKQRNINNFADIEDCHARTGIGLPILAQLYWKKQ